jgi:hypothetical protein
MDLRMTQDRPSMLERFAPGILSGIAMLVLGGDRGAVSLQGSVMGDEKTFNPAGHMMDLKGKEG